MPSEDYEDKKTARGGRSRTGKVRIPNLRLANPSYIKAAHSRKAEAVVKVASYARGFRVQALMAYVGRTDNEHKDQEEVELEDQDSLLHKGSSEVKKLYQEWRTDFSRAKPGAKRLGRDATHIIFSAKAENTSHNQRRVLAAAREVAASTFRGNGFDYVIGLHQDGNKPHVHIIVRNKNRDPEGPKLRLNKPQLLALRQDFANELTRVGLEHVATLKRDRPHIVDRVRDGADQLREKKGNFLKAIERNSPSFDAFAYRRAVARSISKLREAVKKKTIPATQTRNELLKTVRDLEKELTKNQPDIRKQMAATIKKFGCEARKFRTEFNELTNPTNHRLSQKAKKIQAQTLAYIQKQLERDAHAAKKAIEKSTASPQEKKEALIALGMHEKAVKNKDMNREVESKVIEVSTQVEKLILAKAKGINPITGEKVVGATGKLYQRRAFEKLGEQVEKNLTVALTGVQKAVGVSPEVKKTAIKTLRQHQKRLQKTLGLGVGLSR